jgi:hypothetical protein
VSAAPGAAKDMAAGTLRELLLRVGFLNYAWTNTESLLIHVIAGLLATPKDKAVVVFLTLNTTRARIDLVERLAKLDTTPRDLRDQVLALTERLRREAPLRNKYNHCIYSFDPAGAVGTILMRVADRDDRIRMGKSEPAGEDQFAEMDAAADRLRALNADIWRVIKAFGFPL